MSTPPTRLMEYGTVYFYLLMQATKRGDVSKVEHTSFELLSTFSTTTLTSYI